MALFRPIQISMPYPAKDVAGQPVTRYNRYNVGKAWQKEYTNDAGQTMTFYDGKIELFPKEWDGRFSLGLPVDTARGASPKAVPKAAPADDQEVTIDDIPFA